MAKLNQIYKCSICGNIIEVVHPAAGNLACCDKDMDLQEENTVEASLEKHVPVVERVENGYKVSVGSIPHPMSEEHYIEWIEILADEKIYRKNLRPGDEPMAEFCIKADSVMARAYCNLHGLWKS